MPPKSPVNVRQSGHSPERGYAPSAAVPMLNAFANRSFVQGVGLCLLTTKAEAMAGVIRDVFWGRGGGGGAKKPRPRSRQLNVSNLD